MNKLKRFIYRTNHYSYQQGINWNLGIVTKDFYLESGYYAILFNFIRIKIVKNKSSFGKNNRNEKKVTLLL